MNAHFISDIYILFDGDKYCSCRPQNFIKSVDRQNVYHVLICSQISEQIFETK